MPTGLLPHPVPAGRLPFRAVHHHGEPADCLLQVGDFRFREMGTGVRSGLLSSWGGWLCLLWVVAFMLGQDTPAWQDGQGHRDTVASWEAQEQWPRAGRVQSSQSWAPVGWRSRSRVLATDSEYFLDSAPALFFLFPSLALPSASSAGHPPSPPSLSHEVSLSPNVALPRFSLFFCDLVCFRVHCDRHCWTSPAQLSVSSGPMHPVPLPF